MNVKNVADELSAALEAFKMPSTIMSVQIQGRRSDSIYDGCSLDGEARPAQGAKPHIVFIRGVVFLGEQPWIVIYRNQWEPNKSISFALCLWGRDVYQPLSVDELADLITKQSDGFRGISTEEILDKVAMSAMLQRHSAVT